MENKIARKISKMERDIMRYKEALKRDLESNDLDDIEKALKGYSQDILSLVRAVEELKELC